MVPNKTAHQDTKPPNAKAKAGDTQLTQVHVMEVLFSALSLSFLHKNSQSCCNKT